MLWSILPAWSNRPTSPYIFLKQHHCKILSISIMVLFAAYTKKTSFLLDVCLKSRPQLKFNQIFCHNFKAVSRHSTSRLFVFIEQRTKLVEWSVIKLYSQPAVSNAFRTLLSPSEIFFLGKSAWILESEVYDSDS